MLVVVNRGKDQKMILIDIHPPIEEEAKKDCLVRLKTPVSSNRLQNAYVAPSGCLFGVYFFNS